MLHNRNCGKLGLQLNLKKTKRNEIFSDASSHTKEKNIYQCSSFSTWIAKWA